MFCNNPILLQYLPAWMFCNNPNLCCSTYRPECFATTLIFVPVYLPARMFSASSMRPRWTARMAAWTSGDSRLFMACLTALHNKQEYNKQINKQTRGGIFLDRREWVTFSFGSPQRCATPVDYKIKNICKNLVLPIEIFLHLNYLLFTYVGKKL